ncbi:condensation domain-containing protein [Actinoplanes sp. CA-252034]|uniref:condensation domain-containing protein n=1 Tax=Actinoplanes sp. CA-252034 TaxID=3239906 RepID=UPI003D9952C6
MTGEATVARLLADLDARGIRLRADGDNLRLDGPRGALDADLLGRLKAGKTAILEHLRATGAGRVPPAAPRDWYPLSAAQERLYFNQLLTPDSLDYHIVDVFQVGDRVDAATLERALRTVVRRHDGLRTAFDLIDGEARQRIDSTAELVLETTDEPGFDPADPAAFLRPFDLTRPPLLRAGLVRAGSRRYLLLDVHHLVFDGASRATFAADLAHAYRGEQQEPLPVGYPDFAVWQRAEDTPDLIRMRRYWQQLMDPPSPVPGPARTAHPGLSRTDDRQAHLDLDDAELVAGLRRLCRAEGVTPFMALLAAYVVLLRGMAGRDEVVVGFPVDVRADAGLARNVGLFINTVPIRVFPTAQWSFRDLLRAVRDQVVQALDNCQYPYDRIVGDASARRNLKSDPLVDGFFNYAAVDGGAAGALAGIGLSDQPRAPHAALPELPCLAARFDLTLSALAGEHGFGLDLQCMTAMFDSATVGRLAGQVRQIVEQAVADPGRPLGPAAPEPATDRSAGVEQRVRDIVGEILGIAAPELDDDFFAVGGHSLLAAKLVVRIDRELGVRIPIDDFLGDSTLRRLSELVRAGAG